jgi:hypothetical protein
LPGRQADKPTIVAALASLAAVPGNERMTRTQAACIYAALPWLALASGGSAYAQTGADNAAGSINLGARGGIAFGAPVRAPPAQERPDSTVEFSFRAGAVTDYIYRGTTLSAHQPAVGAAFEATLGMLYGGASVATVKLPSEPVAEIAMSGGIRPKLGDVQFDFGATYFAYPGETPPLGVTAGIHYWEAIARADTKVGELLRERRDAEQPPETDHHCQGDFQRLKDDQPCRHEGR